MPCGLLRQSRLVLPSIQSTRSPAWLALGKRRLYTGERSKNPPLHTAVIVSHDINRTTPTDLIEHIEQSNPWKRREAFALFLLTPSFSHWLLDDHTFLLKALNRAYGPAFERLEDERTVHTLAAVVDRLPAANTGAELVYGNDTTHSKPVRAAGDQCTGFEGLAYALLQERSLSGLTDTSKTWSSTDAESQNQGVLTILHGFESSYTAPTNNDNVYINSLQVPLANTIFQTGQPTTMTYSRWLKLMGSSEIRHEESKSVGNQIIRWPGTRVKSETEAEDPTIQVSTLEVPLVPLTVPRCIEAGMGNIVRRIVGGDGKSTTASQELESAVPAYFKARNLPPQSMSVWALVIPASAQNAARKATVSTIEDLFSKDGHGQCPSELESAFGVIWTNSSSQWRGFIEIAMANGARLHRVLSGGGGWGKKAGLLALDPSTSTESPGSAFDAELNAIEDIVQPGEYIQFFTFPVAAEHLTETSQADVEIERPDVSLELGTIPSSIDSMPNSSTNAAKQNERPTVSVFRDYFGALSEGGMTLVRKSRASDDASWNIISDSKIDVPFSRFRAGATSKPKVERRESNSPSRQASFEVKSKKAALLESTKPSSKRDSNQVFEVRSISDGRNRISKYEVAVADKRVFRKIHGDEPKYHGLRKNLAEQRRTSPGYLVLGRSERLIESINKTRTELAALLRQTARRRQHLQGRMRTYDSSAQVKSRTSIQSKGWVNRKLHLRKHSESGGIPLRKLRIRKPSYSGLSSVATQLTQIIERVRIARLDLYKILRRAPLGKQRQIPPSLRSRSRSQEQRRAALRQVHRRSQWIFHEAIRRSRRTYRTHAKLVRHVTDMVRARSPVASTTPRVSRLVNALEVFKSFLVTKHYSLFEYFISSRQSKSAARVRNVLAGRAPSLSVLPRRVRGILKKSRFSLRKISVPTCAGTNSRELAFTKNQRRKARPVRVRPVKSMNRIEQRMMRRKVLDPSAHKLLDEVESWLTGY